MLWVSCDSQDCFSRFISKFGKTVAAGCADCNVHAYPEARRMKEPELLSLRDVTKQSRPTGEGGVASSVWSYHMYFGTVGYLDLTLQGSCIKPP